MSHDSTFIRRGRTLNLIVLTLMVACAVAAYALATLAASYEEPGQTILVLCAIAFSLAAFTLFYARFIEPSLITVTRRRLSFPLPGLRIAVIGDFHIGPYKRAAFMRRIVRRTNALSPDIILLVGDFLFDHTANLTHLAPLEHLRSPLGTFAVMGNHDSGAHGIYGYDHRHDRTNDIEHFLTPLGVSFLRNSWTVVGENDRTLCIAGVDDVWMQSHDVEAAFSGRKAGIPTILLAHNPDMILNEASHRAHLIVSGHTHGGQVRLPFYGPLSALPQKLNKKFDRGLFPITDTCTLAITHGIGETFLPLRLCARPEVLLIETQ